MKYVSKLTLVFVFGIVDLFGQVPQNFRWSIGGGGIGSPNSSPVLSIGFGQKISDNFYFEVQGAGAFTNNAPEYVDTDIPHGDYSNLGEFRDDIEVGICLLGHIYVGDFILIGTGGFSRQDYVTLVNSNVTSWNWKQDGRTEFHPVFGGGIGIEIEKVSLCFTFTNRFGGLFYLIFPFKF